MSKATLTSRDLELFRKLSSHGMLSSKQVGELFFPGVAMTTVLRRLRLLERGFYIRRILGLESQDLIWLLGTKGASAASVHIPKRHWSKNMLEHDFKLLSLRLLLEANGVAKAWTPEHVIRSKIFETHGLRNAKKMLIPDGLMAFEANGIKHSIAIEVELNFKSRKRYLETFNRYSERKGVLGVWYLAKNKGMLNQIRNCWYSSNRGINLYCSFLDEVLEKPLDARIFNRNGHILIKDAWKSSVPVNAQGVSTQSAGKVIQEIISSAEDHTPLMNEAS